MNLNILLAALLLASPLSVKDVDLVTVTDDSVAVRFHTTGETSCSLAIGPEKKSLDGVAREDGPETMHHFIEVGGLDPGRDYYYRIECGKKSWPLFGAKKLTTLNPPPGERLFSFAVINDVHAGEDVAGLMVPPVDWLPPFTNGFTWRYPAENYWEFTLRSGVAAINKADAELVVANGDLTSWYTEEEFNLVKSHLDRLEAPYYVVRGNHDRVGENPEDYFLKVFELKRSYYSFNHKGHHFVMLDDNRLADGWHGFQQGELDWFERDLSEHREMPTFVFCHRPVGAGSVEQNKGDRNRFLSIVANNPQVGAVINGHSHAANIVFPEETPAVPYIEVPALKEYPVGYGMFEVHENGFMYTFHFADCPDCREWDHITRDEYFGMAPSMLLGGVESRSLSHEYPAGHPGRRK